MRELVEKVDEIVAYHRRNRLRCIFPLQNLKSRLLGADFATRLHRCVGLRPVTDEFDEHAGEQTVGPLDLTLW